MGISDRNRISSSFLLSEPFSTEITRPTKLTRQDSHNTQTNHEEELESDSDLGYDGDIETSAEKPSPKNDLVTEDLALLERVFGYETLAQVLRVLSPKVRESVVEDLALLERVFGYETLGQVLRVLSPEVRKSVVESMIYEARFLADSPAAIKHTKAIIDAIVGEIVEADSELERIAEEFEFHRSFWAKLQERQEENRNKREVSDHSIAGFDLKLVEVPFDESGFDLSTQSSLGKAILETHDLIARQEEEEELKPDNNNCDNDNDSPKSKRIRR